MLARVVARSLLQLPPSARTPLVVRSFGSGGTHSALTVGAEYVVYAVERRADGVLLFVADDAFSVYPFAYARELFEIVDHRPSRLWKTVVSGDGVETAAIPQWADDDDFYIHVVDGEDGGLARQTFLAAKATMDLEFVR